MLHKQEKKKLTDADRHKRFVETAKKVEASDDPEDFDRSFYNLNVTKPSPHVNVAKEPQKS